MTANQDDQDPSMDDILASIRRIMLDEQARLKENGPAVPDRQQMAAYEEPPPPLLVLDESMAVQEPAAAPILPPEPAQSAAVIMTTLEPIIAPISAAPEPAAPEPAAPEPVAPARPVANGPFSQLDGQALEALLAPAAAAAASASVEAMLRQLQSERDSFLKGDASSGPSLEQVVRGEIRPMLKAWLDEHLPEMVERLVTAELARLTLATGRKA